jgi:hypothetical protein
MQESPIFEHLLVMVIEDMINLIHVGGLAEHVRLSLSPEAQLLFVDLEQDPPKVGSCCRLLISVVFTFNHAPPLLFGEGSLFIFVQQMTPAEKSPIGMQLVSIHKSFSFSLLFPQDGMKDDLLSSLQQMSLERAYLWVGGARN